MSVEIFRSAHFLCLDLRQTPPRPAGTPPDRCVLCLGNFDGVHIAHAELLSRGIYLSRSLSVAREEDVACGVLCFFRPPSRFLSGDGKPVPQLTPLREKLRLFAAAGIEYAYLCDFSRVRTISAEDFLTCLETEVGCVGAVCGFNHRFGAKAAGNNALLVRRFGEDAVVVVPEITVDGVTVSSTNVREALLRGDVALAARLLGRPYSICTTVRSGKRLGRAMGFPTANQRFSADAIIPAHGVYAALCHTPAGVFPAVANIGSHPTVDEGAEVNCETYILGYEGDLYGRHIKTELLSYLRPERRFPDLASLQCAIAEDAKAAAQYIAHISL